MPRTKKKTGKKKAKKNPSLAERREAIRKRHEKPTIVYESDLDMGPIYPTRFMRLNAHIGGGLRGGKITELFGFEDSGKTSLAMALAADVQRQAPKGKQHVVMTNYEIDEYWDWWRILGMNTHPDYFTQDKPKDLEEGIANAMDLVESGEVCAWIVDSIYAANARVRSQMIEKWRSDKGAGAPLGTEAVRWGEAWTSFKALLREHGVVTIAVNQMREKIETGGGPKRPSWQGKPVTTPRGHALKFYSSLRMRIEGRWLEDKGPDEDGILCRMRIQKIRGAAARGICDYRLIRGVGFDTLGDLIDLSLECGAIEGKGGGFFNLLGKKQVRGRDKLTALVRSSEKIQAVLKNRVSKFLEENEPEDPDVEDEDHEDEDE